MSEVQNSDKCMITAEYKWSTVLADVALVDDTALSQPTKPAKIPDFAAAGRYILLALWYEQRAMAIVPPLYPRHYYINTV